MSTAPPRWQVLSEADHIIASALAGKSDDPVLRRLAMLAHQREFRAEQLRKMREGWEKFRLSPFFKLYVFYFVMFAVSILLGEWQKRQKRRQPKDQ